MSKAFEDDNGNKSSMRLIWAICVLTIMAVWAVVCIKNNQLYSFELGDAALMTGLFGGKVAQKYLEAKNGSTNGSLPKG